MECFPLNSSGWEGTDMTAIQHAGICPIVRQKIILVIPQFLVGLPVNSRIQVDENLVVTGSQCFHESNDRQGALVTGGAFPLNFPEGFQQEFLFVQFYCAAGADPHPVFGCTNHPENLP